jgi:hypothetical protein
MGMKRNAYRIFLQSLNGSYHCEDPDVDGIIILKWIFREIGLDNVVFIHLPLNKGMWRALTSMAINLRAS